jgi:hypothetical protein
MPNTPTPEELQKAVSVICKVIGQMTCFHFYELHVPKRFGSIQSEITLETIIYNAVLDSALLNIRCFNEFFQEKGRKNDVRAHHYPGLLMKPFLTPDDVVALNKYLVHITTTRSDIVQKAWLIDQMVLLGLGHGIQFLSFIDTEFPLRDDDTRTELRGIRTLAETVIKHIAKQQNLGPSGKCP